MREPVSVEDALRIILAAIAEPGGPRTILIDGPSGSGKSRFADLLIARWPLSVERPQLLRLDDVYPGWSGLDEASRTLATGVLAPRAAGVDGAWQRWDWQEGRGAEWHPVSAVRPLIVEGCGASSRASAASADLRIWIEAEAALRKRRALERDAGAFDAHWDAWDVQWLRYVDRERPEETADLLVDGD